MAELSSYPRYGGTFPFTSSIAAALRAQGFTAPHSGKAWSDPMLMGLSGGIAFGYFIFAYEGVDPQVNLLTRNTFDSYGWDAVARRLGLVQDVFQTAAADKARDALLAALDAGTPPIVWADVFTLGYETSDLGPDMWSMQPLLVSAYEPGGEAFLDDRAGAPIRVPAALLDAARQRVKKDRYRMVTLDLPSAPDLPAVVRESIHQCVLLFTAKPPKGSANNFGFTAYERWTAELQNPRSKSGWFARLPPGRPLAAGLASAFRYGLLHWKDASMTADREMFAEFLREASGVPGMEGLAEVAGPWTEAGDRWRQLGDALLPDGVAPLADARRAMTARHREFLANGNAHPAVLQRADRDLGSALAAAGAMLEDADLATGLLAEVAEAVVSVRDAERVAVAALSEAIGAR